MGVCISASGENNIRYKPSIHNVHILHLILYNGKILRNQHAFIRNKPFDLFKNDRFVYYPINACRLPNVFSEIEIHNCFK